MIFTLRNDMETYAKWTFEKQQVRLLNRVVASRDQLFSTRSYFSVLHDCLKNAVVPYHRSIGLGVLVSKDKLAKSRDRLSKAKRDFYDGYRQAKICRHTLYHHDICPPMLHEDEFVELLWIRTLCVEFLLNDTMHWQCDAVPWGHL